MMFSHLANESNITVEDDDLKKKKDFFFKMQYFGSIRNAYG